MAQINFLAGQTFPLNNLSGSGLGFYGPGGYNTSVNVGQYQDTTYITDATGTAPNGIKVNNVKWIDQSTGQLAGGENRPLLNINNYLATLNIQVTNSTPIITQNPQLFIYDRGANASNPAVGVVTKVAVLCNTATSNVPGSGSSLWETPGGTGVPVIVGEFPATISPGSGGFSPGGANTSDTQHDWYFAISAMPTSIGAKTQYGLQFYVEYR